MILPDEFNYSVPNFECTHSKVGENKTFHHMVRNLSHAGHIHTKGI